ncbi:MAG TPA: hypothetical protein VM942_08535 [Acidimicrobiales bacterium]|nr:hypothetical protein [Acidimicrobiales bacterium]
MTLLDADPTGQGEDAPGPWQRLWRLPFRWHLAALAIVLLALLPLMSPGSAFTSDEGAYALQAAALEDGGWADDGWAYDYRAAPLDPAGANFPIILSPRSDDSFYTYVSHPAYPVLLTVGRRLLGPVFGMHLLSLIGALGAAAAAWMVAAELDRGSRRLAFWLVAAGPAVANGYVIWAHSLSAALAGVAIALAIRIVRRGPSPLVLGGLGLTLATGALLRSEAVLLALVVAVAVAVAVWRLRRQGIVAGIATLAALAGPTALAVLAERRWTVAIVGGPSDNLQLRGGESSTSYIGGRITGSWHDLFNGYFEQASAMLPVLLTMGLVLGLGFLALRRWRPESRRDLAVVAVAAVGLVAARMILFPGETVTGLFAAWPLALLGVLLLPRRTQGSAPGLGFCLVIVLGFMAAVVLTEYPEGGGVQWGGRFFSPVLVPLGVLAVIGFRHRLADLEPGDRRWAAACLSIVAAATAVLGIFTVAEGRARHDRIVAAVSRHPAPVMVTTFRGLPRIAWREDERLTWMISDKAGLGDLLARLDQNGVTRLSLVTPRADRGLGWPDGWTGEEVDEPALRQSGLGLFLLQR